MEIAAVFLDDADIGLPFGGIGIVRGCGQLRKPDDGVERRIDFVCDVADEDALHPVALFGGPLRAGEVAVHAEHHRDEDGGQQEDARQADGAQLGAVQALFLRLLVQFGLFHVQPVDVEQRGEFPERLFVVVVDPLVIQVDEVLQVLIGGPEVAECCVGVRAGFVNIVEIRFRVAFVPEQSDQSLDRCECLGVFVRGFVDRQLDFGQVDIGEVTAVSGLDLFEQGFGLGDLVGLEK